MRSNTIVMLIIALVFGAIAVFLANMWLSSQQARQVATPAQPTKIETETIVVAVRELKFGEPLKSEILREIPWPRSAIPDGAFAKIADVNKDGQRVVLTNISTNEPVLKWKISGPGERASMSALVTEGMRAVAIRVNDVVGVAGFVLPGDRVDVLYSRGGGGNTGDTIDVLLQNVRILAVNHLVDEKKSEPVAAKVVTVEVNPTDAQILSLAQKTGALTLTLRAAGSLDQAPAQRIVEQELGLNPSVYLAGQEALNARIEALQSNLSNVAKRVEETDSSVGSVAEQLRSEIANTGAALSTAMQGKLTDVEETLKEIAAAAGKNDEALRQKLSAQLKDIEARLHSEIASNDASGAALKAQLAALEKSVRQTAEATGQGEQALRAKLAALEEEIRKARTAGAKETDAALRAKLAEFEASLRALASKGNKPVVTEPIVPLLPTKPQTASVKMYRGMKSDTYQVPVDQSPVDVTQFVVEQE